MRNEESVEAAILKREGKKSGHSPDGRVTNAQLQITWTTQQSVLTEHAKIMVVPIYLLQCLHPQRAHSPSNSPLSGRSKISPNIPFAVPSPPSEPTARRIAL